MESLTFIKDNEVYTSTTIIAQQLKKQNRTIYYNIEKYKNDFKDLGVLTFKLLKPKTKKGGRPTKNYFLNEEQFIFLITILRTNTREKSEVMRCKKKLSKDFVEMRKWILNQKTLKSNEEYKLKRKESKIGRRQETDIIKLFIAYAVKQGSKSANRYYCNISTMENKAFFILQQKYDNVREILNITQLSKIVFADLVVKNALLEGMSKEMHYKDIFQLAKERILIVASSVGIETLPAMNCIDNKQVSIAG